MKDLQMQPQEEVTVSDVFFILCVCVYRQQCHNPFIMVSFAGLIINLQLRKKYLFSSYLLLYRFSKDMFIIS